MHFASDNWAGAHPAIADRLSAAAAGFSAAYATGDLDKAVQRRFAEVFEHDVAVYYVGTGTAANALAMTALARPGGVAFCHRESHMVVDECGAPEYFSGGARLCPVDGTQGRMDPAQLRAAIARYPAKIVHHGQPMAVSLTQASEIGTVHSLDDIRAIAAVAEDVGLPVHMDGARFANALVALGCTPAEMTWKSGVEIVSFGGTKNGCWCAEALVVFEPEKFGQLPFLHKRAAQLFSKSRFISAQFDAYLEGGLWLETARHANAMAAKLADRLRQSPSTRLAWEPQANEVFAIIARDKAAEMLGAGAAFHPWGKPHGYAEPVGADEEIYRFVASFATTEEHVDKLAALL